VLGVVTVALAAAAHVAGGGVLPSGTALIAVVALMTAVGSEALGRPASRRRVIGLVVGAQASLHAVFALGGMPSGHLRNGQPIAATVAAMPGMQLGHAGLLGTLERTPAGTWSMLGRHLLAEVSTGSGVAMLLAHTVAAVIVGCWLAAGERLLWSLIVLLRAPVAAASLRASGAVLALASRTVPELRSWLALLAVQRGGRWNPRSALLVTSVDRRGPPVSPYARSA
jgi:hypothetical protein